ncbi:MAG: DUF4301 family protein [Deltaproteobacteria bacterium]|nr:DUF4301 family protein [Deltaproteobacteria bacterium]
MDQQLFTDQDLQQIKAHGLSLEAVKKQLDLFNMPRPFLKLEGPCTVGNGITRFDPEERDGLAESYEREGPRHRCVKFVPASGAASRMFKTLLGYLHQEKEITRDEMVQEASAGDQEAQQLLGFVEGLKKFAFFRELQSIASDKGFSVDRLLGEGRFRDILNFLLTDDGLDYANLPKGLLLFHEYPKGSRTAFDEHLVEAASYVVDEDRDCRINFTVSQEHLKGFHTELERVRSVYEERYNVAYDVSFSMQERSTDTLAVDLNNRPFRKGNGRLLFRPGGHGALLENLNHMDGDIIFIKNIDNVVPDHLKPETFTWKKITGGYLIAIQRRIFGYMKRLASGDMDPRFLAEAVSFMEEILHVPIPGSIRTGSSKVKRAYMMERLDRPVRVCGMVKNVGEPGGGPFWVKDETGQMSLQIVETAQIDPDSKEQQDIFKASTHFNPVDLVCGVRDWQGRPFDLRRFIDPKAVFISQKSKDGKDLKALEHPGLWNGSMARWITLFVEVPGITFNPVKTVNDLLRKEHQPG